MADQPEQSHSTRILTVAHKAPLLSLVFRRLTPHQREIVVLLKETAIFGSLSESELVEILDLLHERTYAAGEVIFREGEPGLCVYAVFKGEVAIGNTGKDGKVRLARLGPGEIFGEVSFLDGSPRSATATVDTKTELIALYDAELRALLRRNPVVTSKILFAMARRLGMRLRAANLQMNP